MRCPKCGNIVEDGRGNCFVCGANLMQNGFGSGFGGNNGFSTGMGTNMPNNNPNMGNMQNMGNMPNMGQNTQIGKQYLNNKYDGPFRPQQNKKKTDKDIFDFFSENKGLIRFVLLVLVAVGIFFGVRGYINHKNAPVEKKPILNSLYFEIDDSFISVPTGGSGKLIYTKSGSKGSDCSITVSTGTSTSGNHIEDFYEEAKKKLEPAKDKEGNIIEPLKEFKTTDDKMTISGNSWYYMNVYYRSSLESEYSIMKYKYISSVYKGYFYDIELVNNANDNTCNTSLDKFTKSLKFIEENKK